MERLIAGIDRIKFAEQQQEAAEEDEVEEAAAYFL